MRPTLIKQVRSPGGSVVKRLHPKVLRMAMKPSTAGELKNMMVEVVQAGTGTQAQIPGVVVAGKTGTAETCACNSVYDAWFIFFAPADHPVVAGAVVVENQTRLRRRDRSAHREAADAGDPSHGVESELIDPMATNLEDRLIGPVRRSLPDREQARHRRDGRGVSGRGRGARAQGRAEDANERHARDDQFVERFKREARNAAGLSHPHIVRIYDRGQAEGTYYIAMEYLDGQTLKELLVRKGPCPPLTAIKFAREILSALAEAHRHEIVHRDIKPHNVIVSPDWNVKVTDFGIARSGASQMTEAGSIVGTAQYLSPEQARGKPSTSAPTSTRSGSCSTRC